jgi:hypothetical protein
LERVEEQMTAEGAASPGLETVARSRRIPFASVSALPGRQVEEGAKGQRAATEAGTVVMASCRWPDLSWFGHRTKGCAQDQLPGSAST